MKKLLKLDGNCFTSIRVDRPPLDAFHYPSESGHDSHLDEKGKSAEVSGANIVLVGDSAHPMPVSFSFRYCSMSHVL